MGLVCWGVRRELGANQLLSKGLLSTTTLVLSHSGHSLGRARGTLV